MVDRLALYKKLYLVRQATEAIRKEYPNDQIKTPVHLSMGAEAISVGICQALIDNGGGQVFGTYRNHALYLSLTSETDKFFAELYGKKTGASGGKAGSMHLTAPEAGLVGTSAVVGTTIPMAVGAAFANRVRGENKVVAVFFGDGALDEGVFWESFNVACLWKLPIMFVCEDNGLAPHTKKIDRQGYDSVVKVISGFKCFSLESSTTDIETVHRFGSMAHQIAKLEQQPVFLHFHYYRYLEHVGTNEDFNQGYRDREEFEKWFKVDPVKLQKNRLLALGWAEEVSVIETEVAEQIERSLTFAKESPFPDKSDLFKGVMA